MQDITKHILATIHHRPVVTLQQLNSLHPFNNGKPTSSKQTPESVPQQSPASVCGDGLFSRRQKVLLVYPGKEGVDAKLLQTFKEEYISPMVNGQICFLTRSTVQQDLHSDLHSDLHTTASRILT